MFDDCKPQSPPVFSPSQIEPIDNSDIRRYSCCNLKTRNNKSVYSESFQHQCYRSGRPNRKTQHEVLLKNPCNQVERQNCESQHEVLLKNQNNQTERQNRQSQHEVILQNQCNQIERQNRESQHKVLLQNQCNQIERQNCESQHKVLLTHPCDDLEVERNLFDPNNIRDCPHGTLVQQQRTLENTNTWNHSFEYTELKTDAFYETKEQNDESDEKANEKNSHDLTKCHHKSFINSSCDISNIQRHLQHSVSIFQRILHFVNKLVVINSAHQRFQGNILSCATLLFSIFALQITLTASTASSSVSSSSSSNLQLNIGILVAESTNETFISKLREESNKAIDDFRNFIQLTEENSNISPLQVNYDIYSFNDTRNVVSNLDRVFSNATIHAVLSVAKYDMHSSLIPLADAYDKAYIPVNSFIQTLSKTESTNFAPKFFQRGQMLAKVLDMYKWQKVHIIYSNQNVWEDFATYLYFAMTFLDFKVTLGTAVSVPITLESAHVPLRNVVKTKVVVLLMDVGDQLSMLEAASALSMTTKHAFFTFSRTPYDGKFHSVLGLEPEVMQQTQFSNDSSAPNISIFESLFVIAYTFPVEGQTNSSAFETVRIKRDVSANTEFPSLQSNKATHENQRMNRHRNSYWYAGQDDDNSFKMSNSNIESVTMVKNHRKDLFNRHGSGKVMNKREAVSTEVDNMSQEFKGFTEDTNSKTSSENSSLVAQARLITNNNDDDAVLTSSDIQRSYDINEDVNRLHSNNSQVILQQNTSNDLQENNAYPKTSDSLVFESENQILLSAADLNEHSLLHLHLTLAAKFRSKRDIVTSNPSDADLLATYDLVFLLAYAVYLQVKTTNSVPVSEQLITSLANLSFPGRSGKFQVDQGQQVSFDFQVYDFNVTAGAMKPMIYYQARSSDAWDLVKANPLRWPGGVVLSPDECFKQLPGCDEGLKTAVIGGIVAAVVCVTVVVITVAVFIRRNWLAKEMTRGPNKVILSTEDLVFVLRKDMGKGSRIMKSRVTLLEKDNAPDLIRGSDPNRSMASINELSDYTETARYNGDLVHVKELNIKGFEMRSKLLTFIRLCRDLRHENLNPYVGFLADSSRPSIIMEYCSRGSLYDIVHNEDFKLDWDFKLSLLTDLVRGIRYLHCSALRYHGHMTSKCCVIDSRFVLKITDYGVSGIMERCKAVKVFEAKDLLWSAPELLRDASLLQRGSDKGDLYAVAIIFQEVALRTEPYSTTGLTPEEIVKKLKKPPPLIRPSVTPQAAPPLFIQIMKQCWSEMPEMRPHVDEIYDQFKKLTGGKKANIVDTMFKMLEKYSTDLEDIVAERTMQLEEEKKKTDQLLFRMLPSTVAESLKIGRTVEAECFDEVTIYFSDIVGFTTISAMSTPMQVVDLLNDLYSMFDATINNHDVYKVETIGDAYMVVSGLPIRNGNRHAGEIATLALVLLSQCGKFTIRHMPHLPLRLRIGLHTGSCVAGVVGLTMPRFCLFGDTVNTASRMESSGAAFRIHISEACKVALDVLGGYKTEYRGQTELKGKGMHNTYWLVGKEGFDKELPEPPQMVGDNTHGLDSILGDLKIDFQASLDLPKTDVSKSSSAPDLAAPLRNALTPPASSSKEANTANSHPENLHEVHKQKPKKTKPSSNKKSIVTADVNITGAPANSQITDSVVKDKGGPSTEGSKAPSQSRHSDSNDSGFGSERKHSDVNDCYLENVNEQSVGEGAKIVDRTLPSSSSDNYHRHTFLPKVDVGEDLSTVSEI